MSTIVLDASAILALVREEIGAREVEPVVRGALVSSVNWSEVLQKIRSFGLNPVTTARGLPAMGLQIIAFDSQDAENAADLWEQTRAYGLSLGDRACLSLARRFRAEVLTADRAWQKVNVGVPIRLIR